MLRLAVLAALCAGLTLCADDPPKKLTAEERKELEAKWLGLMNAGGEASQAGKTAEAVKAFEDALQLAKQLYNPTEYPKGHPSLAVSLNNLASVYQDQGKFSDAEPLYKDALDTQRRLDKPDLAALAGSLDNLATLYKAQGRFAEAEPLMKEALNVKRRLYKGDHHDVATSLNNLASLYWDQGKLEAAEPLVKDALGMYRRLYKGDSRQVATALYNLATLYKVQGKLAEAEPYLKDALDMNRRLYPGNNPVVASSLNNLAALYLEQGKLAEAEPLYKDALEMRKRLFKGDHPDVATSLNNLALIYDRQERFEDADLLFTDAYKMLRRLYKDDHPTVASSLNNLALLCQRQGKLAEAEKFLQVALDMKRRLYKGDHPDVALSLNNLAALYRDQGKLAEAEPLAKEGLEMARRLFKGDHPRVAGNMSNLAALYRAQGKLADAERLYKDALEVYQSLVVTYGKQKSEGETLILAESQPFTRDGYLSVARMRAADVNKFFNPASTYPTIWRAKGAVTRIFEHRQLRARAAATDLALATVLAELSAARRRRAELLLAPVPGDPDKLKLRETHLQTLDVTIARSDRELAERLPSVARQDRLADALPAELQKVLPADAAVVDFVKYWFIEWDKSRPLGDQEKWSPLYLGFVVTREKVSWVDLGSADTIESAVAAWREAITSGKDIPAAVPAKVRELVWEKVRKELPANIKTVYIAPDAALCRVPWGAIPGDKPGTILLEDFAIATIPHAPFLLDKLWEQDKLKNPPSGSLVVGGVNFNAEASTGPANRDLPIKPGTKAAWQALPGAAAEATGVESAAKKKGSVTALKGEAATPTAVLAALPKARYAHFATHGFFADPSFRSAFQLDEKNFVQSWRGERVGRAALSPLVMTGLVFAGANDPNTPGRGIVTGEALVDLDLSGLELAVLSACETGLGDVAGGEGTFGLQRAFHLAGTRDVVASLWKVPDAPTAALMAEFYRNLWEMTLSPMESLRQAQLTIYRNPGKIAELAAGFRAGFKEVKSDETDIKPTADGKAHPRLWAAFTLSGPGR